MSRYGVPFSKGPEVRLAPHPRSCELEGLSKFLKFVNKPMAIDLFCGAGGLSFGLHLAGFEVVLAVDKEREAAETHRAHFPGVSLNADLSDETVLDSICDSLEGVQLDLVAGGPPCQPYSQAAFSKVRHLEMHHGKVPDTRRDLWKSFLYVVKRTQPRAVLIENVPDMAFGRDGIVLRRLVNDLEALGYAVHTRILCSDAYGVPQHRQRLFTVAFKEDLEFSWPKRDEIAQRKLGDAIADLPPVEGGDKQEVREYFANPGPLQRYFRQGVAQEDHHVIYDHHARAVRKDDLEAFKLMTSKTLYRDLPSHLKRYRDDIFEDKYKRLDMDCLSRTITAHISQDGYWYIHPTQHRTLTIREAARIQTFPDCYRFCGFPRHALKQIGEAVPPLFGHAVASAVLTSLLAASVSKRSYRTRETAAVLENWISDSSPSDLLRPWFRSPDTWTSVLGQLLFDRASPKLMQQAYQSTLKRWATPQDLLDDKGGSGFANGFFKSENYESLLLLAEAFINDEELSSELLSRCNVPATVALRILAVTGTGTRRPLNAAVERLVNRFTGESQQPEDGRGNAEMRLGRIVGCDPDGKVFCAISEIASKYCGATHLRCSECPLRERCAYATLASNEKIQQPDNYSLEGLFSSI
jgi:DNA (cytosine-5)-methyltransferase 1